MLRGEIRRLDLEFRQRYFRRLALNVTGGWLLVAGVGALLLAAQSRRARLTQQPPRPQRRTDAPALARQAAARARWSVAGLGALLGTVLLALAFTSQSPLPDRAGGLEQTCSPAARARRRRICRRWRSFRPTGRASGDRTAAACSRAAWNLSFDGTPGWNVIWKSPVPALGFNSPVVWSNRVFISGGDAKKREVFCFDAGDGKLLWQRAVENVPGSPATLPEIPDATGYAASTMAMDGRRAFALFANGDLAAFNFDGTLAWSKYLGVPKNMYGHASSLAIWPGKLVVQLDQDEGAPGGSKLLAFDCATGRPLWERPKPTHGSWASPIIVEAAGKAQIITLALPFVMSSSLADGNELWRAELMEGEITPSPIFAAGLVLVVIPSSKLVALRPDGAGDVTKSHVAWTAEENIPDVTSPVSNGELVFTVTSSGLLTCFDAKDGEKGLAKGSGAGGAVVPRHRRQPAVGAQHQRRRRVGGGGTDVQGTGPREIRGHLPRQPGVCERPDLSARGDEPVVPVNGKEAGRMKNEAGIQNLMSARNALLHSSFVILPSSFKSCPLT